MPQASESCNLILSVSECSQSTKAEVSSGSLKTSQDSETSQVQKVPECKASDLSLCSVENDNTKLRLDAGHQALSENCEKAKKEGIKTAGKPVMQLVSAGEAGNESLAPTAHQDHGCISGSQAAEDQSGQPEILSCTQGREAQSEGYPLEETSEPEAVPETQCEEQEELQVEEKQINEDESLVNITLSQRFILEREVQSHEDMEVDFAGGSCKNSKKLSDQTEELGKVGPECCVKETLQSCTFGIGEAKNMDKLSSKAASENMPKLSKVLSKPSVGELMEQHNNLFPKLKTDVSSEVALCVKSHPDGSELDQAMKMENQTPLQEKGVDMLVAQQENCIPKSTEDTAMTRNLEQDEKMQPQERVAAKSPSPSNGK